MALKDPIKRAEYNKQYRIKNKEKIQKQRKEHREANKEKISEAHKKWYSKNKEYIIAKSKEYTLNNYDKVKLRQAEYRENNRDTINARQREYVSKNKKTLYAKNKKYRELNKEALAKSAKKYRELNRESILKRNRLRYIEKFGTDRKSHGSYNITNAERFKEDWVREDIILYKLKLIDLDGTEFFKIGLTINLKKRLAHIPYNCEIISQIKINKYDGVYMERHCIKDNKNRRYIPLNKFKGYSECYK